MLVLDSWEAMSDVGLLNDALNGKEKALEVLV